jgi:hypothetical protein
MSEQQELRSFSDPALVLSVALSQDLWLSAKICGSKPRFVGLSQGYV